MFNFESINFDIIFQLQEEIGLDAEQTEGKTW